jgi:putative nucleotidyltransferase with HDIG domain
MSRPHFFARLLKIRRHRRGGSATVARRKRLKAVLLGRTEQRPGIAVSPSRVGLAAATVVLLSLLLCIHLLPNRVTLKRGDIADQDVIAPRTIRYADTDATRLLRDEALRQVTKRYEVVPDATGAALDAVRMVFDSVDREALTLTVKPKSEQLEGAARQVTDEVRRQASVAVSYKDATALLKTAPKARLLARSVAVQVVERTMGRAITDDGGELEAARQDAARDHSIQSLPSAELRTAVAAVAGAALTPTRRYDARETERDRQSAVASIPPQIRRIPAGAAVVRAGEQVTQQHLDAFEALGLQNARTDATTVSVVTLLVVLLVSLAAVYLRQFHRILYDDTRQLVLLSILAVFSVLGLKIGSTLLGLSFNGVHFGYLGMMCVASAGMVIALLISPRVATFGVALLSIASGLILNNELRYTVITLSSSLVGIVCVSTLRNRTDYLRAGLILCGANAVINVLVGQLQGDLPQELIAGLGWGVVSGMFALALFYFGVAAFERLFGITTHLRLLELSDPATPILQQFRMRVPGTYAHSLMVGTLSHAAAEAIGADALLVRVAAYYHDIGKMNRPEFFIENQSGGENVHDRLSPTLSALVLISHVKEGLVMAEEVGLPPRVREVMEQHHGTTLIKYFYFKATGGIPDTSLEPQFRYPGPKPQTKEAAILMLADTVEAASRTLDKPTPARIADFVARIVEDKRSDGQLDDCDLTLRDLQAIQEVFTRTLSGTLHARIQYPDQKSAAPAQNAPASISLPTADRPGLPGETSPLRNFHRTADEPDLDDTDTDVSSVIGPMLPGALFAPLRGEMGAALPPPAEGLPLDTDRRPDSAEPDSDHATSPVGARGSSSAKTPRGRRH